MPSSFYLDTTTTEKIGPKWRDELTLKTKEVNSSWKSNSNGAFYARNDGAVQILEEGELFREDKR